MSPRQRHQADHYVPPDGHMEMMTSQREAFKDMGRPQRLTGFRPGSSQLMRTDGKFQGSSSYTGAFSAPEGMERRQLVRPRENYQPAAGRFEGTTTMQDDFKGAFAPRQHNFRPQARPLQNLNAFEDNVGPCRPNFGPASGTPVIPPITA